MSKRGALLLAAIPFIMGLVLGAIWHKSWLFPFPQLSHLSHNNPGRFLGFAPNETDYYVLDSVAGHIHKPYAVREYKWREHPQGSIRVATNNLGFREDTDTIKHKGSGTYRILVTGDSHIDGVVYNAESFPNRLEAMLNLISKKLNYEVINGGTGYYGPHNYSVFLRKFMFLSPDMYVVVFYTGNDFLDGLRTAEIRKDIGIPARSATYWSALQKATAENQGAVAQALNQIHFFNTYPALTANAVDIAIGEILEIHRLCKREGIGFIVLALPTKCDIERDLKSSTCKHASELLFLKKEDLEINKKMTKELLARLNEQGIKTLDLLPAMQSAKEELFWEEDYHLNSAGHALLARTFVDHFSGTIVSDHGIGDRGTPNNGMQAMLR